MKFLILTAALIAVSSAASLFDPSMDLYWQAFKHQHNKQYANNDEETQRRLIWEENVQFINKHNLEANLGKHTYTVKMNKFGDLTNEEFVAMMNGFNKSKSLFKSSGNPTFLKPSNLNIPDSVDWRKQGYVTPIKDQGQCGSCWAFSAVASLEGQHFKASGQLVSLSEQNLVDCSRKFGNIGCDGGLMDQAFDYIKSNKGIDTEVSYPYKAIDQKCKFSPATVGATDTGFTDITSGDEDALTAAIASIGPISVAIDASQDSFQFYSSGIYSDSDCSSSQLDHGVTAVGYGSLGQGQDFYIVKNSWGTSWGDSGYIMMARNQDNMCGIATAATHPFF
jgi:cathepsin L